MRNRLKIALIGDADEVIHLEKLLQLTQIHLEIIGRLSTTDAIRSFLSTSTGCDLLILGATSEKRIVLPLLHSMDVLRPIIVCSTNEEHALKTFDFDQHCIGYLITPITAKRLKQVLEKYTHLEEMWKEHVLCAQKITLSTTAPAKHKKRFLVRNNQGLELVRVKHILCFYSENGRSFLVGQTGKQFYIDFTLERLEGLLDPEQFYRINRKVMVNIDQIQRIEEYVNNRLKIKLHHKTPVTLVVSRKRVKNFKLWLREMV
ncbi:MAG: LytTR family DNA-binding domain-containing protein [Bacteroidota bacterium]